MLIFFYDSPFDKHFIGLLLDEQVEDEGVGHQGPEHEEYAG